MKCARSQELLSAFLDRELNEAASSALRAHLAACESCAQELEALQQVKLALRNIPAPRCPDSVWQSLSVKIAQEPMPVLPRRRAPLVSPVWAVAAAAMLAIGAVRPSGQGSSTLQALLDGPVVSTADSASPLSSGSGFSTPAPSGVTPAKRQPPAPVRTRLGVDHLAGGRSDDRIATLPGGNGDANRTDADGRDRERTGAPGLPLRIKTASAVPLGRVTAPPQPGLLIEQKIRNRAPENHRSHSASPAAPPAVRPVPSSRPESQISGHVLVAMLPANAFGGISTASHRGEGRPTGSFESPAAQHFSAAPGARDSAGGTTGAMTPATTSSIVSLAAMADEQHGEDAAAEQTGKDLLGMALEAGAVSHSGDGAGV